MKEFKEYINEKANFIVKNHVQQKEKRNYEGTVDGFIQWALHLNDSISTYLPSKLYDGLKKLSFKIDSDVFTLSNVNFLIRHKDDKINSDCKEEVFSGKRHVLVSFDDSENHKHHLFVIVSDEYSFMDYVPY